MSAFSASEQPLFEPHPRPHVKSVNRKQHNDKQTARLKLETYIPSRSPRLCKVREPSASLTTAPQWANSDLAHSNSCLPPANIQCNILRESISSPLNTCFPSRHRPPEQLRGLCQPIAAGPQSLQLILHQPNSVVERVNHISVCAYWGAPVVVDAQKISSADLCANEAEYDHRSPNLQHKPSKCPVSLGWCSYL